MDQRLFGKISYRSIFLGMWAIVLFGLLCIFLSFIYVAKTKMPNTSELENPKFEQATIVYSSDGREVDRYFRKNREWVKFEELSPYVIDAVIATEDHRYFDHSGIDARGTARAFILLGTRGGASTITQQLAKQFFTPLRSNNPVLRIWQKMKEWVIAIEFERRYTKEEILAMFLNKFDFYYGANGISAAAQVYFGKNQRDLSLNEAAILIGMLKNPYFYNPNRNPEIAKSRRITVLSQMKKHKFITEAEYHENRATELDMSRFRRKENYGGLAPYFMAELKKYVRNLLDEKGITKPGGETYDLDMDGLKIYTTIDSRYQIHAEAAMKNHMTVLQEKFAAAWKNRDPWEYVVDGQSKSSRITVLNDHIETTDQYRALREQYLQPIIREISTEYSEARLWNNDIRRLFKAETDPKYLSELISRDYINRSQKSTYEDILKSKNWPRLKKAWKDLENAVRKEFNTKRKMTVYSHKGPIEMVMTPIDSIKYMLNFLQLGSVAMDPQTGYVKAWIGGVNYQNWKYDHVTSNRQVGSTFKPFLYTAAIMNGYSPCYKIEDKQYTIPAGDPNFGLSKSWSPKNSRGEFTGEEITLTEALKKSLNSASIWLMIQLGSVNEVTQIAENMGIEKGKIGSNPSIALGAVNLSVLEMTSAYSTYANNGVSVNPVFIEKILDKNGVLIYQDEPSQRRSIPENYNYAMVSMLKNAGSAVAYKIKSDFGGKTGTTNSHVDGWFMGITPRLVVGTWVGGEFPWIRFTNFDLGQGSVMARPFYLDLMSRIESDSKINFDTDIQFTQPSIMDIELDCSKYESPRKSNNTIDEFDNDDNFN